MRSEPLPEAREDVSKRWRAVRPRSQSSPVSVFCLLVVACFAAEPLADNNGTQGQLSEFTESQQQCPPRGHCSAEAPVTAKTLEYESCQQKDTDVDMDENKKS